jgi:hypothetical protein
MVYSPQVKSMCDIVVERINWILNKFAENCNLLDTIEGKIQSFACSEWFSVAWSKLWLFVFLGSGRECSVIWNQRSFCKEGILAMVECLGLGKLRSLISIRSFRCRIICSLDCDSDSIRHNIHDHFQKAIQFS